MAPAEGTTVPEPAPAREIGRTLAERIAEVRILTLAPGHQPGDRLYSGRLAGDSGSA